MKKVTLILCCSTIFGVYSQPNLEKEKSTHFYINSGVCFNKYDYSTDNVKQNRSISSSVGMGVLKDVSTRFSIKTGFEFMELKTRLSGQRVYETFLQIPLMLTYKGSDLFDGGGLKNCVKLNVSLGGYHSYLTRQGFAESGDSKYNFKSSSLSYGKIGYTAEIYFLISSLNESKKRPSYLVGLRSLKDIGSLSYDINGKNLFFDKYSTVLFFIGFTF